MIRSGYPYISLLLLTGIFFNQLSFAQEITTTNPFLKHTWRSSWISHPSASLTEYGVFHFRKTFEITELSSQFIIHLSADNQYRFFVNGTPVCKGPAIGDLQNWYYESIDIAPYLQVGNNVVSAQVYNLGSYRPGRQISYKTSFILQSENQEQEDINTNETWKVMINSAYEVLPVDPQHYDHYYPVFGFYTAGPGDKVNAKHYPWGWEQLNYDDSDWENVKIVREDAVATGVGRGYAYGSTRFLIPRPVNLLEERPQRFASIARSEGLKVPESFIMGKQNLVVPPRQKATILLDAGQVSIGYPELKISKGMGSTVKITYAEALLDSSFEKGHRDDIKGKKIYGIFDLFLPDGGSDRIFRPLWLRAFRFVQLDIETADETLVIHDYYNNFSAYPLQQKARFETPDQNLSKMLQVGWRTLELCAQDNYMSDAYYEQMQYIGDARAQALATFYMSGDESLYRHALTQIDYSRVAEGLTMSRYPARELQIIPSYSLAWIAMIHDYMMIRNDKELIKTFLPGMRSVLRWFGAKVDTNGLLSNLTWWYFPDREPNDDGTCDSHSALATLQFIDALQKASEITKELELKEESDKYLMLANELNKQVYENCFVDEEGMFADAPGSRKFTQSTNAMAVLTSAISAERQEKLMERILEDDKVKEATLYYKFYVFKALEKIKKPQLFIKQLQPWQLMLDQGMTAFGEVAEQPRSDCHPWSALPNIYFFSIICGIQPTSFGSKTINIRPDPGSLKYLKAVIPHVEGEIILDLKQEKRGFLEGTIELPEHITGNYFWNDKIIQLKEGKNKISFKN